MPLIATRGAASAQGFGEFAQSAAVNYIEDVFSTYLYNGNGTGQTITNGIDLSTKGGLVWIKCRTPTAYNNWLSDTVRGNTKRSSSNTTSAESTLSTSITSFNSNGFSIGSNSNVNDNGANETFVSWTFRKQPKFFDIVTYTGDGATSQAISHNLQSVPGVIIVKRLDAISDWLTGALFTAGDYTRLKLNGTNVGTLETGYTDGFYSQPTSSTFAVNSSVWNVNGGTYVAYLFAHNAGGFGLTGTDNVISCGTFTTDGSGNATVTLGYEPQWVLNKTSSSADNWTIADNMRGFSVTNEQRLYANLSNAEAAATTFRPTATGYTVNGGEVSKTYIYIAIRRGPMKVPTSGTSVFSPNTATGSALVTTNFPVDASISSETGASTGATWGSRLQGTKQYLLSYNTGAEASFGGNGWGFSNNTGLNQALYGGSTPSVFWNFQRAPGYMDVVCYTGDGTFDGSYNVTHNLGAVPEFIIAKRRDSTNNWNCYHSGLTSATYQIRLNLTAGQQNTGQSWGPTSTTFKPQYAGNADNSSNQSGGTYVAYLFATCAGVSKVGSYTGNGSTQTIDCGFTGGARFVLIKRIDVGENGDWYVYDTARGMTVLTDPYLLLNSTAAQVATLGSVTTVSTGFALDSTILAAINVSAASYIFLAVA